LSNDDLREKIGQMIMVGFYGTVLPDTLVVDIQQRNLGGVLLFAHNMVNPQQIKNLTDQLNQLTEIPLFISTDQEGGLVARLDENNGFEETYTALRLGTIFNSEDSTRAAAAMMAKWLSESGINVNLAPVVDVNVNPSSPAIGYWERSFSNHPMTVFNHASWFIDEFHQHNIITTLKHFPGHGSATEDSHLGWTDITTTWADSELVPYQELFTGGSPTKSEAYKDIVMVGHLYNSNFDTLYPASLSYNVVTNLLRQNLNFQGIVISDEMFMQAITGYYTFEETVELAINAGIDILLFRTNEINGLSLVREVIELVVQKVSNGDIAESRINESYQRIMELKQRITSVEDEIANLYVPTDFTLKNYPNPFNTSTNIVVNIAHNVHVDLKIYNILGEVVCEIIKKELKTGTYIFELNGSRLFSGIYYVRMETSELSLTRKIMLIK